MIKLLRRRRVRPGHATPGEAVRFLASVCDGAVRRDGVGFQKDHVEVGHGIARTSDSSWEPWQRAWAVYLVRYYRRQLVAAGFDPQQILRHSERCRCQSLDVSPSSQWVADPYGFADLRWWNGTRWTGKVAEFEESLKPDSPDSHRISARS